MSAAERWRAHPRARGVLWLLRNGRLTWGPEILPKGTPCPPPDARAVADAAADLLEALLAEPAPSAGVSAEERARLRALAVHAGAEPGAVLAGIVRGEEHERAALVRERDEAVAAAEVLAKRLAAAEEEAARLRIEAIGRGRHSAQLALFAPPAADPAGEAQRSGAAVGAIVGAAADAQAPKPAKVPAPVCAPCGGVPLVPAADMPREGEATGGKPLGCPACGEGYDGTPEQIARAQADSDAATRRLAKADGKCWRCGNAIHRGRCKGSFR